MSKIKILRIQSRICVGGPALNTILLSAFMDSQRYSTKLVGGRLEPGEKTMEPQAFQKGVTIHMIEEMGRDPSWMSDIRALRRLIALIREYKPHIVHTHTAKAGAIGRLAAFLCRVPIRVHTFHGHVFHGYFHPLKTWIYIWIERFLALLSTRIVTISPAQEQDLTVRFGVVPKAKSHIIRLGFELGKLAGGQQGVIRAELGLAAGVRLAGIVARLVPIKNHQLLLHAIAFWRKKFPEGPETRFLVIGDGESREGLEQLSAELGIDDLVVFLGWRRDLADIYADLELNILVSKNEGTPVTLIEGLACGIPILTTDVGGIRDFADAACGRIVPADMAAEDLADHLGELLASGQVRLDSEVRDRIGAGFDVSRLVADMEHLYEELLAEKGITLER